MSRLRPPWWKHDANRPRAPARRSCARRSCARASTSSTASPAARSCRSTTRSGSIATACTTCSAATSRAPATPPKGYARASGEVGVCVGTSGPGATNLVTPIADAWMDGTPLVAITGQVPSALLGTDAFQEVDITGMTVPITKHNYLVTCADDLPRVFAEAFHIARTGRPGPVLDRRHEGRADRERRTALGCADPSTRLHAPPRAARQRGDARRLRCSRWRAVR